MSPLALPKGFPDPQNDGVGWERPPPLHSANLERESWDIGGGEDNRQEEGFRSF
jgi:hypothetical protein